MLGLGAFAAVFAVYGLVAVRAERVGLSRPLVFVVVGALVALLGVEHPLLADRPAGLILNLAEIALALVLFSDAARLGFVRLRRGAGLPLRLLGPGVAVSIGLGTLLGLWPLGGLDGWECAVLAAILSPTDVTLCAAAVRDERVPQRIRQALIVESGLNDGPAVTLLLLFVAGATVTEGLKPGSFWVTTVLEKVGVGVLVGVVVGLLAGELARCSRRAGWSTPASERLAMVGSRLRCSCSRSTPAGAA